MKNHIGIYFVSKYGQTQKIANYIAQLFRQQQTEVEIINLERTADSRPNLHRFDAVLIGAPVYEHHYSRQITRFVQEKREKLQHIPATGFFSVCLAATPKTPEAYA